MPDTPKPEPPKKSDLVIRLEKMAGGEKEATKLIELADKVSKKEDLGDDFLHKIIDAISAPAEDDKVVNVEEEIQARDAPFAKQLSDFK